MKQIIFVFLAMVLFLPFSVVLAQNGGDLTAVAQNVEVSDVDAKVGDILSATSNGLKRSVVAYDSAVSGVIVEAPIMSVEPKSDKTKFVATSGTARVRVLGQVAVGDFIATSTTAGVGQKATESGYVLGKALAASGGSGDELVAISIEKGYWGNASGTIAGRFFSSFAQDSGRLRSSLAALITALAIIGGVVAFARVVNSGVTSIGRNPLARATIVRGMVISGSVVVVIMLVGLGAALAIVMVGG